ncbi:myelin protein zero-like protein 3 isoform X2 [Lethenteron reissneri]|uniref:myelin protein zero-like protein 3 isoform X2 n=1 Tax=Lethenteron reissneri TaxID=7753 RepID=UPI002AB627F5|nr:myelin protein zero-like protein 3 isoform X2 [Lethenteron reissneri]
MASIAMKLLGISCFLSCGRSALAQGLVKTEVGSDVLLPCLFNEPVPDDEMVSWERKLANGSSVQVLVFHDKSTPRLPNIEWVGDLSRGNASVKISAVGIEDAGDYSCATFYSDINLSITLSVVLKVVEAPSRKNDNGNGEPTTGIILAAVALLVIAVAVVGFVIAKKMRERRRRNRDNESGTPPSTELQVLAPAASTA